MPRLLPLQYIPWALGLLLEEMMWIRAPARELSRHHDYSAM